MKTVGRPLEKEIDKLERFADKLFVGDSITIESSLWDDGDVHYNLFSTIGSGSREGYSNDIHNHREVIKYKRGDTYAVYLNRLEYPVDEHKACKQSYLQKKLIDFKTEEIIESDLLIDEFANRYLY